MPKNSRGNARDDAERGIDPDLSFDEKKEVYRISNKIVRTMNVTQSAVGDKRGLWTTVLGAAILIGEDD